MHRIKILQKFKIIFKKIKNAKIIYYNNSKYFVSQKRKIIERKVT